MPSIEEIAVNTGRMHLLHIGNALRDDTALQQTLQSLFKKVESAGGAVEGLRKYRDYRQASGTFCDLVMIEAFVSPRVAEQNIRTILKENASQQLSIVCRRNDAAVIAASVKAGVSNFVFTPLEHQELLQSLYAAGRRFFLENLEEECQKCIKTVTAMQNEKFRQRYTFDSVTHLKNQLALQERMESLEKNALLVLVRVMDFALIKQLYGNQQGTQFLEEFAGLLQTSADAMGYELFYYWNEQFALLMPTDELDTEALQASVEALCTELESTPFTIRTIEDSITVSVTFGISFGRTMLLENAQLALDDARQKGEKIGFFNATLKKQQEYLQQIVLWRKKVKDALREDRIFPVFQPIVDREGNVVKFEALVRMVTEESGESKIITPFHFLESSVRTKLYSDLSETVIFKALDFARMIDKRVSINFSYQDIINKTLGNQLDDYFERYPEVAERIVFEIIESEQLDYKVAERFFERYRSYGIKIAIDDFGSGFSNFEQILNIRPDYIKIDGSLIQRIDSDERSRQVVWAISDFAYALGTRVIAEYVHSELVLEKLKFLNIDEYQGYYFYKPLQMKEALKLCR